MGCTSPRRRASHNTSFLPRKPITSVPSMSMMILHRVLHAYPFDYHLEKSRGSHFTRRYTHDVQQDDAKEIHPSPHNTVPLDGTIGVVYQFKVHVVEILVHDHTPRILHCR